MAAWSRIIRFIAKEDGKTYYGQPEQEGDIGLMYHDGQQLTAKVLSGSPVSPNARLTDQSRTVSRLLSPLSADDIPEIRGLAAQYAAPGKSKTKPAIPGLFYKPRTSLTGPETPIIIPRSAKGESSDYEVEICVVIGKPGRDIPVEKAYDHVLGYTTVNDVTCRGVLAKVPQPGMGKSFDTWTPLGPMLVHPSALGDPMNLQIETRVGGELKQKSNTGEMVLSIPELIHYLSRGVTLQTGSLILTGSPLPLARPPPPFMSHGDEVRCWVEGCGTLINSVVEEGDGQIKSKL